MVAMQRVIVNFYCFAITCSDTLRILCKNNEECYFSNKYAPVFLGLLTKKGSNAFFHLLPTSRGTHDGICV